MVVIDWSTFFLHLPIGIIAALLLLTHEQGWSLALCFIAMFIVYEVTQNENAWIDIQGAIAGIPIGGLFLWLIRNI